MDRLVSLPAGRALVQNEGRQLPPIIVSGLVGAKAALAPALRVYIPQLADLEPLDGGRSLLRLAEQE